jgi:hypothetical protein
MEMHTGHFIVNTYLFIVHGVCPSAHCNEDLCVCLVLVMVNWFNVVRLVLGMGNWFNSSGVYGVMVIVNCRLDSRNRPPLKKCSNAVGFDFEISKHGYQLGA